MAKLSFLFFIKCIFAAEWTHYRLPESIRPTHYDVELKPYLDPADQGESYTGADPQHFDGTSTVHFTTSNETTLLVMHTKYIDYQPESFQ